MPTAAVIWRAGDRLAGPPWLPRAEAGEGCTDTGVESILLSSTRYNVINSLIDVSGTKPAGPAGAQ